jgi:NAD(P)-dependent dehydrogenase (short-subunit alcohol dehydrogenase family)
VSAAVRVAVVTGASSGIGAALARELRSRGWHVVGLSRRPAPDADEHEQCDVADRTSVDTAAARVLERHPRIDLLVNNAGIAGRANYLDAAPEVIEGVVETNYLGSVWCLRAFLPGLGDGAALVNMVSVAGTVAVGPYSASKHAQLAFSRSVAVELRDRGVHVLAVLPGFVETPGFPQRGRLRFPLSALAVESPAVARRTLDAVERKRHEIYVPRWYRAAAWLQALAPALLTRRPALHEQSRSRSDSRARR